VPDVPLVKPHPIEIPVASPAALERAAELILKAERPLVMLGAAASRPLLADALSDFVRRMRIPYVNTQMGKGSVAGGSNLYMVWICGQFNPFVLLKIKRNRPYKCSLANSSAPANSKLSS
jgi:thiamine pyrophosphate-dependent acetolactate synthase large subunit-like protein